MLLKWGFIRIIVANESFYINSFVTVRHPYLTSPHRGGGNVFPPPLVGGVRGGGVKLIHSFNVSIAQRSRNQLTTPVSPPSQGGDKREGKKLAKTCPHENGEKKFLHTNTINGKTVQ